MREGEREGRRKEGRKKMSISWVQESKKCCSMVMPLWVLRTRGKHNKEGKKREKGGKRRGKDEGEKKRG